VTRHTAGAANHSSGGRDASRAPSAGHYVRVNLCVASPGMSLSAARQVVFSTASLRGRNLGHYPGGRRRERSGGEGSPHTRTWPGRGGGGAARVRGRGRGLAAEPDAASGRHCPHGLHERVGTGSAQCEGEATVRAGRIAQFSPVAR
jgi:hypothetical protein